ncbi:MAG: TIGR02452 family protein [Sphaerochaetaceae bacterium]
MNNLWNANKWKETFIKASQERDRNLLRTLRIKVFEDTLKDVRNGFYITNNGKQVKFDDDEFTRKNTILYKDEIFVDFPLKVPNKPIIEVIEDDVLSVTKKLINNGENPAVLNLANRQNPGGGVTTGAGAQEEYLFRCSNYYRSLYQFAHYAHSYSLDKRKESYPLDKNFGGIYSPKVTIFRKTESQGYEKLERPWKTSFIAVPALHNPALIQDNNGLYWLTEEMENGVKNKIRTIYRIALINGHTQLVLGAFGCGAFKNPPHHIAKLFHEVLNEKEFTSSFTHIVFAIIDNHNSHKWFNPNGNFIPFKEEFSNQ